VLQLPFADASFDVVLATTMTHHLSSDCEVIAHFCEASRVARRLVLICDLHRNPVFLSGLWALMLFARERREFRHDAVLSVRRGWRTGEWHRLAAAAGMKNARVWFEHGTRVLLAEAKV
jgi:ubiquinone/menaquinone biosynthesis C-methylase UbiE